MLSGFFWKKWGSPYREIYTGLLLILLACMIGMFFYQFQGLADLLGWSIIAQSEPVQIVIETFNVGAFTLQTTADSEVFSQRYVGNFPEVNVWSYYFFLIITTLCLNVLVTVVTTLPRFWYFAGTSLLVVVLVNLKLELLLLFGYEGKIGLIIALALFLPTTYIFNAFKSEVTFAKRLLVFLLITAVLGLIILFFSEVSSPFFYLASYSLINPLIISLAFILMIAHEIIAAFIYLLTKSGSGQGKGNLRHFAIISVIYLANLFITYLKETNIIDWDFLYINLFLLLGISATLGIWSYAQRESQYDNLFNFKPVGAFFYLAMATCCFVTIAHFKATANDPAIEVFKDFIIYAHLGYGIIFIVYILANFLDPLKRNMQVFKVLYKPMGMPYFTYRLAGLIAFIAFLVKSNWEVPVNQGMSAYYNSLGDLHMADNELTLAKYYYSEGAVFGYNNHKSNYALASLAHQKKKADEAIKRYQIAGKKNPSPQSYVNQSNIYVDQDRFFDALFILQEAQDKYQENGQILNNLGLLYSKTRLLDSAGIFIDKASKIKETSGTAGSNMLSLLSVNDIPVHPDSVVEEYNIERDPISINNGLILKNKLGVPSGEIFQAQDSALSYLQSSILYNIAFNHLFQQDSLNTQAVRAYSLMPANINYREPLQYVAALNLEKNEDVNQAFRQLNWLANTSQEKGGDYFNTLGLWALKHRSPDVAAQYFEWADNRNQKNAKLNLAIALTEGLEKRQSIALWQELLIEKDRNIQIIASNILSILSWEDSMLETDRQRYYFLRYRTSYLDTVQFEKVLNTIESDEYKASALFDMTEKLWSKDLEDLAIMYYAKLSGLKINNERLFDEISWFELKMLATQGNIRGLATKINEGFEFDEDHVLEKHYYTGLLNEASGDTTSARKHYEFIAYKNPFFPESIIAAANFLNINDRFEAYNILLSALEINPNSVRLLKAYILQCARIENSSYAEISLETLSELVAPQAYREFRKTYESLLQKVKEEAENF